MFDAENNYQIYEMLGDGTCNKFIVWYMYRRFPVLQTVHGVQIIARLKINYCGNKVFSTFGEKIGLWDFISSPQVIRQTKKKQLLEDVFEALVGAAELLIDKYTRPGCGSVMCNKFLTRLFDEENIPLTYESLYDAKTRLKELFDSKDASIHKLGKISYRSVKDEKDSQQETSVFLNNHLIASCRALTLSDSEQNASELALTYISKTYHIKKQEPNIFKLIRGEKMVSAHDVRVKFPIKYSCNRWIQYAKHIVSGELFWAIEKAPQHLFWLEEDTCGLTFLDYLFVRNEYSDTVDYHITRVLQAIKKMCPFKLKIHPSVKEKIPARFIELVMCIV